MTKLERVIKYMDTNLSNRGLAYIMADACYECREVDRYWQDMESFDGVFRDEQPSQVAYLVINAGRDFDLNDEFFRTDFVEELQSCSAEKAGEDIRDNLEEYARILVDNDVYDTGDDGLDSILESEED